MFFTFIPPTGDQFYITSISFFPIKIETQQCCPRLPPTSADDITTRKSCVPEPESETFTCTPAETIVSLESERLANILAKNVNDRQSCAMKIGGEEKRLQPPMRTIHIKITLSNSFQGWREDGVWHLPDVARNVAHSDPTHKNPAPYMLLSASWAPKWVNPREMYGEKKQPAKPHDIGEIPSLLYRTRDHRLRLPRRRDTNMRLTAMKLASSDTKSIVLVAARPPYALPEAAEKKISRMLKKMSIQGNWFPLFLKLPAELRLRIYFLAFPKERLVDMVCEHLTCSPTSIPSLLQVSYETRLEALRFYTLQFRTRSWTIEWCHDIQPRIYCDMQTDIPFFNCHRFPKLSYFNLLRIFDKNLNNIDDMDKVQTMAICPGVAIRLASYFRFLRDSSGNYEHGDLFLKGMPLLKRVICVSHGKSSLANASILPLNPDVFPTVLDDRNIEILELLFGVKLEFGAAGEDDLDDTCACAKVGSSDRS